MTIITERSSCPCGSPLCADPACPGRLLCPIDYDTRLALRRGTAKLRAMVDRLIATPIRTTSTKEPREYDSMLSEWRERRAWAYHLIDTEGEALFTSGRLVTVSTDERPAPVDRRWWRGQKRDSADADDSTDAEVLR